MAGDSPHRLRALLRQPAAVPGAAPQHARRHLQPPALLARGGGRHPAPRRWQVFSILKCIYLKWLKRGFLALLLHHLGSSKAVRPGPEDHYLEAATPPAPPPPDPRVYTHGGGAHGVQL